MHYSPLGHTGLYVSELTLGTMTFASIGTPSAQLMGGMDQALADRMGSMSIDAGINLFDSANMYGMGESEAMLGRALGARRKDVVSMILRGGHSLAIAGIPGGLVSALGFSQVLASQLYGVSATDPLTYLTLAMALAATAVAASVIPALRATRVDPAVTLWQE